MALWAPPPLEHNYLQVPPPAEVRSAESLGVQKWVEIDMKRPVITLMKEASWKVKKRKAQIHSETAEKIKGVLLSPEKKAFLQKLYLSLKDTQPLLKKAIENQTIQLFDIPERNLFALSLDWKNVDFLYEKSGKEYFDFYWSRSDIMRYSALMGISEEKFPEKQDNWTFYLILEWKKIPNFSDTSLKEYSKWADYFKKITIKIRSVEKANW